MKNWMVLGALAMAGCCFVGEGEKNAVTAVSPDGKNEFAEGQVCIASRG